MNLRYLTVSTAPSDELLELLNNNIIGTPGQSMLYQHLGVNEKIGKIKNPYFLNLERSGHIAGTACFCKRVTRTRANAATSFYVRYFSFKDIFRRKSASVRLQQKPSVIREEVNRVLGGEKLDVQHGEKFLHYAYVDTRNERSAVLCREFGFEPVRQYTTLTFSRLFPKTSNVYKIVELDAAIVQPLLQEFYGEFSLVSFANLQGNKYYFLENNDGKRIAGVQVNPDEWKIHSLPGFFMNSLIGVFSATPILNRILSKRFRFLTFENFYWAPGNENCLETLLEHLLAKYKVNTGLCIVDRESKMFNVLKSLKLGVLNRINKEVAGDVICRFENFSDSEKSVFKNTPAYISGIDAT